MTARADNGLSQLKWDEDTASSARLRSMEIPTEFSHTRPDGRPFWTSEIPVRVRVMGEILARNGRSAKDVFTKFMSSDAHRKQILNPDYDSIGIRIHDRGEHAMYWAVLFGRVE